MFGIDKFHNIGKGNTSIGIEFILASDKGYEINAVVLEKKKSLLQVVKKINSIGSIAELLPLIDLKTPIVLVFNGKGIVHRKVNVSETDTVATLLNKVLPNANAVDFYIQQQPVDEQHAFVSIVRSDVINDIIDQLIDKKITSLVSCLLGPFSVNNLLPLIDISRFRNQELHVGTFQLQISENQISEIKVGESASNEAFYIADEKVEAPSLIAFGAALSFFTGVEKGLSNAPKIEQLTEEFRQKLRFTILSRVLLISSFCILIVNYLVFTSYWSDARQLTSELAVNQGVLSQYDTLKKEFGQKKEFLLQNGLLENAKTSYYADRLAETLPPSIRWTDLTIYPLKKKDAQDETASLFFEKNVIKISGKCQKSTDLNEWMKRIKKNIWVGDLKLIDYKQENASDEGLFLIQLTLKESNV